jgi:hypothetical protein
MRFRYASALKGRTEMPVILRSAVFAALALLAGGAFAHSPPDPSAVGNLPRLSAGANLVIQGKATKVEYRTVRSAGSAMPYTFVTYSISKVLQGTAAAPSITLRFLGGADGRGGFVSAEGVPLFQPGDEDILFIAHNGEGGGCALVNCEFGRFRVFQNGVYEAHGAPVLGVAGGRMQIGEGDGPIELATFRYPAPSFDEAIKDPEVRAEVARLGLTMAQARARYEAVPYIEISAGGDDAGPSVSRAPSAPGLEVGTFVSSVRATLRASVASRGALAMVRSANILKLPATPAPFGGPMPITP